MAPTRPANKSLSDRYALVALFKANKSTVSTQEVLIKLL